MLAAAITHAERRWKAAETAAAELDASQDFEEAEAAWTDFLLALNGIYSKFEQGAKGCPKSTFWFGKQKHLRKSDPLLRYLHFARNADEHGLRFVTERKGGFKSQYINPAFRERHPVTIQAGDPVTGEMTGPIIRGLADGPTVLCVRAYDDRYKDHCDPPLEHLGKKIVVPEVPDLSGGTYPDILASLALPYFLRMLEEARALPVQ